MATFAVVMDDAGTTFVRLDDGRWTRLEKGQVFLKEITGVSSSPLQGAPLKNEVSDLEYGRLERFIHKVRQDNGIA